MKKTVSTSFRLDKETYNYWIKTLPKRGDRSRLLEALVKGFLNGKISVVKMLKGELT